MNTNVKVKVYLTPPIGIDGSVVAWDEYYKTWHCYPAAWIRKNWNRYRYTKWYLPLNEINDKEGPTMRKPKAPAGFVPVDSEEARKIGDTDIVNMYRLSTVDRTWMTARWYMRDSRTWHTKYPEEHLHVQLPPKVEWEEVWGWEPRGGDVILTKTGTQMCRFDGGLLQSEHLNTIVRALNEMEGRDGR